MAVLILLIGLFSLMAGFVIYTKILDRKIVNPDDNIKTPAVRFKDGKDYVPAHPLVLLGHHFSSIAGAGPIVGPIIGYAFFGWGPAFLWIVLGSILLGGVHDYLSLMISVREGGKGIGQITKEAISPLSSKIFSFFIWIMLVLVQSVFAIFTAKTFVAKPEIIIPSLSLIVIAPLFGFLVYKMRMKLSIATIIAFVLIIISVYMGFKYPIDIKTLLSLNSQETYLFWLRVMFIYAFIASVLPVWILLQPRDYLSVYILIIGMILGIIGIISLHANFTGPFFTGFIGKIKTAKGIQAQPLFPMLFILIACGAISGFHSLVSSGTTAKQLSKESHGKFIGYGGMILEGVLALIVLCLIASALNWDNTGKYGFFKLFEKSKILVFGYAFGKSLASTGFVSFKVGAILGTLMVNAFLLTTLDTSTRLARYVLSETFSLKNPFISTLLGIITAYILAYTNKVMVIWPVFGSANQLLAAFTLLTLTAYLLGKKKPSLYTLIPAIFMLIMVISSLIYLFYKNWKVNNIVETVIIILLICSIVIVIDSIRHFIAMKNMILGEKNK